MSETRICANCGAEYPIDEMFQVENEIGMLESARDYSDIANKEYCKGTWRKELNQIGFHTEGKLYEDEAFQAIYYAKYVERLAKNAKQIHNIPLYINAAMNIKQKGLEMIS